MTREEMLRRNPNDPSNRAELRRRALAAGKQDRTTASLPTPVIVPARSVWAKLTGGK